MEKEKISELYVVTQNCALVVVDEKENRDSLIPSESDIFMSSPFHFVLNTA